MTTDGGGHGSTLRKGVMIVGATWNYINDRREEGTSLLRYSRYYIDLRQDATFISVLGSRGVTQTGEQAIL